MMSLNSQISDKLKVVKSIAVCNNGDSRFVKKLYRLLTAKIKRHILLCIWRFVLITEAALVATFVYGLVFGDAFNISTTTA